MSGPLPPINITRPGVIGSDRIDIYSKEASSFLYSVIYNFQYEVVRGTRYQGKQSVAQSDFAAMAIIDHAWMTIASRVSIHRP